MTIQELGELVWRNLNPNGSAQTAIKKEEIISTAQGEYASALWIHSKELQASEGYYEIPGALLISKEFAVKNNMIDLSGIGLISSLSSDQAIQGIVSDCKYVKSTFSQEQKLKNDDSIGDARTFFLLGKKLVFPKGTHKDKLEVVYATDGSGLDESETDIQINGYIGSKVRDKLYQIYGIKVPADHTENSNSNG